MPDKQGKLTPAEAQTALGWLRSHWGPNRPCPFHDEPTNWEIQDTMIQTLPYTGGGVRIGGPTFPLLVVVCSTCGYTVFVNALRAGVVPRAEPAVEEHG